MTTTLNIESIINAYKASKQFDPEKLNQLEKCTQSIHHWNQYCIYHYSEFKKVSTNKVNLIFDRISTYTRGGDDVSIRFVYEANLIAFLNCLHAMLDSFPFLLYTYSPTEEKIGQRKIKWDLPFVNKYKETKINQELFDFLIDQKFNQVKGFVNTIKHQNLIRISNTGYNLFIEEFKYKQPSNDGGKYSIESHQSIPAIDFLNQAHDELIPKLFSLCNNLVHL